MIRRLFVTVFALALVTIACGGDDDDSTVAAEPDQTTTTNASGGDGSPCDEPEPGCPGNLGTAVDDYRASSDACGGEAAELHPGVQTFVSLTESNGGELIAVTCDTFAYQSTYDLRLWDGTSLLPIQVQQWRDGAVEDDSVVLGEPYFDGEHLVNLEKARGPGDCGTYSEWTVSDTELDLLVVDAKECDDSTIDDVDPTTWPTVYGAD